MVQGREEGVAPLVSRTQATGPLAGSNSFASRSLLPWPSANHAGGGSQRAEHCIETDVTSYRLRNHAACDHG